jgi:hypothetical protein
MLNLEFFSNELPEKKVYLVDMSILSILLSPRPGCHNVALMVMVKFLQKICNKANIPRGYGQISSENLQ